MNDLPVKDTGLEDDAKSQRSSALGWFQTLHNRHIFKVGGAYLVLAWLLMQVATHLEGSLGLPHWTDTVTVVFLAIGFPVALVLTWAVDLTPVKETGSKDSRNNNGSLSNLVQEEQSLQPISKTLDDAGKISIAVIPFENISNNSDQDIIGVGLAADIITGLSLIRSFFVISRNSTFQYRGKNIDTRKISTDLNVAYILEGTVQKIGERLRLSVQLVEGNTGRQVWTQRYDRRFDDLFEVQDELTRSVIAQLEPEINRAEYARIKSAKIQNYDVWQYYHQGQHLVQHVGLDNAEKAKELLEKALEIDPQFAPAYASLAMVHWTRAIHGDSPKIDFQKALEFAQKAVRLDNEDARNHIMLGRAYLGIPDTEAAIYEVKLGLELNPSSSDGYYALGQVLMQSGDAEDGLAALEYGLKLSPRDPLIGRFYGRISQSFLYLRKYDDCINWSKRAIRENYDVWPPRAFMISAMGHQGRLSEARDLIEELISLKPKASIKFVEQHVTTAHKPYTAHLLEGLRKAGLPEHSPGEP